MIKLPVRQDPLPLHIDPSWSRYEHMPSYDRVLYTDVMHTQGHKTPHLDPEIITQ